MFGEGSAWRNENSDGGTTGGWDEENSPSVKEVKALWKIIS